MGRIQSGLIQRINGVARAVTTSTGQFGFVETIGSRPDFGFISSVYNGFQNTSSFRNDAIGAECSTGNCTWSVFTSAAVCSSCKDVSSHMKRIKMSGKNGTNIPTLGSLNRYQGDFVRFELPYANIRNYVGLVQDGQQELMSNRTIRTHMTANTTIDANKTVLFKDSETLLMAFIVMRATDEFLDQHVKWEDSQPTATECALYLCANAYETKSESNVMKEHILGSWAHKVPGSYGIDWDSGAWEPGPGAVGWVKDFGSKLYEAQIDRTDLQILIPSETSNHLPQDVRRVFNISHEFIFSAIDFLIDYTKSDKTLNNPLHRGPPDETWNMMGVPWQTTSMPAVLDALWNSTNLTTTFDNVATSLTNQIRNSSPDRHQGELQKWILHVNVDWAYLAYPIFMLVTGIVYVILTIIESTRLRMPVWKESALPTLLHGFDDETQRLLRGESKAAQRKVLVRFAKDEKDCLRLIT
ncbi:hypothetical protein N0V95_008100 [Ascochyta clinopodiicola]|nr:hypothetical protein N0V95_008100 [Ascochyta clinopodiicola]